MNIKFWCHGKKKKISIGIVWLLLGSYKSFKPGIVPALMLACFYELQGIKKEYSDLSL